MKPEPEQIRSIVVTTDLSPEAEQAYGIAASLMQAYGCSLTLLTCIDTSPLYSEASIGAIAAPVVVSPNTATEIHNDLKESLKRSITAHFELTSANYHIIEAPRAVGHSIVDYVRESNPDLVVMSSHGRSGLVRALLGSVSEYVLRHSKVPVLVVPIKAR